jgi:hypothetical protein
MFSRVHQWLGPTPRFLRGLAGILAMLLLIAGLWWWLPAWLRLTLHGADPCRNVVVSVDHTQTATCDAKEHAWHFN